MVRDKNSQELFLAIEAGDAIRAAELLANHPQLLQREPSDSFKWLTTAVVSGSIETVKLLIELGCDVDTAEILGTAASTALELAVDKSYEDIARLLLAHGADANPSRGRPLIGALSFRKTPQQRMTLVKLLVEHGADVNRLYDLYGDSTNQFAALDWTDDPDVIAYLRQHGAKTAAELKAQRSDAPQPPDAQLPQHTPADEVIRYFEDNFGPVDRRALIEIVPTGHPIAIHAIRPAGNRKHLTLFTTGLSDKPMETPPGEEAYSLAELYIQLPGDWPYGPDCPPEKAWVLHWLRKIAQYPHDNDTWLGGPITLIDNEDPPQPLGPQIAFTSWLLLCEKSFQRSDGQVVQLYRLTPIYPEERELERREGAPGLMRAFDRHSVPFVLDVSRKSIAN